MMIRPQCVHFLPDVLTAGLCECDSDLVFSVLSAVLYDVLCDVLCNVFDRVLCGGYYDERFSCDFPQAEKWPNAWASRNALSWGSTWFCETK